jgi:bifunctional DNA-binding transcriptional regulator/antitoxin component of YhaV-PrlF toxin-antitoxin module
MQDGTLVIDRIGADVADGDSMPNATNFSEVIVSETGAVIPAATLRAAGIRPGDRVAFVRTTRGSLVVVPASAALDGPSLESVVGISPLPAGMSREADQAFLREIRSGDEER